MSKKNRQTPTQETKMETPSAEVKQEPVQEVQQPANIVVNTPETPPAAPEIPAVPEAVIEQAVPQVVVPPAPPAPVAAPVITPTPTPAVKPLQAAAKPAQAPQATNFAAMIASVKENGSSFQQNLVAALETYVEDMAPGKRHLPDDAAMKQYTLWVTIRNAVNDSPVEEFKNLWALILAFFVEYAEKALHERFVFRFAEHWRWAKQELDGFQHILNLIKLTADPKVRAVGLKRIDLDRALVLPITDEGRQRLIKFYK